MWDIDDTLNIACLVILSLAVGMGVYFFLSIYECGKEDNEIQIAIDCRNTEWFMNYVKAREDRGVFMYENGCYNGCMEALYLMKELFKEGVILVNTSSPDAYMFSYDFKEACLVECTK